MSSTLRFDTWKSQDNSTEFFKCCAWVNFNGAGTVAIRASGNVSSITDNGTGDYTINFATAMPDAAYCLIGTVSLASSSITGCTLVVNETVTPTVSAIRVLTRLTSDNTLSDRGYVNVGMFR